MNSARSTMLLRVIALAAVALAFAFVLGRYLEYAFDWPRASDWLGAVGIGAESPSQPLQGNSWLFGLLQMLLPLLTVLAVIIYVRRRPAGLDDQADGLFAFSAGIIRFAFWTVLLVGIVDFVVSMLRVEGLLAPVVGESLSAELGRPQGRALYVHLPLMGVALVLALVTRSINFVWLVFLVVIAEFQIVLSRFIFSYEQAYMGDLVRFWYAALFLFASAYTLIKEGHVRVDVFYAHFSETTKARANAVGCLLFGVPLCWTILYLGFGRSTSIISSPLLKYEISQSGFGLYVKYLMAGFLLIFALSMLAQFCGYWLRSMAVLRGERQTLADEPTKDLPHTELPVG
ncbi:TRAP transporter small permease subunit [Gammaproteobacteria bacterium]|nr:TRAP transporter small permease subunit [Gammaproteobacteria bacterium]